jgi:hypothetical protein
VQPYGNGKPPRKGPRRKSQNRLDMRTAEATCNGMQYATNRQNTSQKNFRERIQ